MTDAWSALRGEKPPPKPGSLEAAVEQFLSLYATDVHMEAARELARKAFAAGAFWLVRHGPKGLRS